MTGSFSVRIRLDDLLESDHDCLVFASSKEWQMSGIRLTRRRLIVLASAVVVATAAVWPLLQGEVTIPDRDLTQRMVLHSQNWIRAAPDFSDFGTPGNVRVVAHIRLPIGMSPRIQMTAWFVDAGQVTRLGSARGWDRQSSRRLLPHRGWPATVTLVDFERPNPSTLKSERVTLGKLKGSPQSSGLISQTYPAFAVRSKRALPGTLITGHDRLLYIEGDREFDAHSSMTVSEFGNANDGRFLVLTVAVSR